MSRMRILLANGFGTGHSPLASGTAGTAASLPFWYLLLSYSLPGFYSILVLMLLFGTWICEAGVKHYKDKDPSQVVFDEMAGMGVALLGNPGSLGWVVAAFFLFRFFDIIKCWPMNRIEEIPGGAGVFFDDIVAGLFSAGAIQILMLAVDRF